MEAPRLIPCRVTDSRGGITVRSPGKISTLATRRRKRLGSREKERLTVRSKLRPGGIDHLAIRAELARYANP